MKNPFSGYIRLGAVALGGLLFVSAPAGCAAGDFGAWDTLSLTFLDTDHWTLATQGQLRFRDSGSELFAYLLGPQVVYKVCPYLRLGMNYTSIENKSTGSSDYTAAQRWETEINPRWPVSDTLTLDLRNRFELGWAAGASGASQRQRLRPQATVHLKGLGPLESVFMNNEFFYSYDQRSYDQNRFVPLGLNFRVNSHLVFTTYYMLWSVRGRDGWNNTSVLGTQLSVSF